MNFLLPVIAYIPALVWLSAVVITGLVGHRVATWVMVTAVLFGAVANTVVSGWLTALISLLAAGLMFLLFALTGAVSRSTTVTIIPVLASLPVLGWVALLPGLIVAAAVAAARLRRIAGKGYLNMVTGETLAAMGNKGGKLAVPDLTRLPMSDGTAVSDVKLRFGLFVLAGVAATALVSLLAG